MGRHHNIQQDNKSDKTKKIGDVSVKNSCLSHHHSLLILLITTCLQVCAPLKEEREFYNIYSWSVSWRGRCVVASCRLIVLRLCLFFIYFTMSRQSHYVETVAEKVRRLRKCEVNEKLVSY